MKGIINLFYILLISALLIAGGEVFHSVYLTAAAAVMLAFALADALFFAVFCRFVRINISIDKSSVDKGGEFKAKIRLVNRTPLIAGECCADIEIKNFYCRAKRQTVNLCAEPFFGGSAEIGVKCTHCGNVAVSVPNAYIKDFLGIFRKKIRCGDVCSVMVMPNAKEAELGDVFSQADGDMLLSNTVKADSGDIDGVRQYIRGDRLNSIHWKLSAANTNDDLYVRNFSENMSDTAIVLFEYYYENVDSIIDSVFSVCETLVKNGISFVIMWANGGEESASQKNISCEEDFKQFLAQLYTCYPSQNNTAAADFFKKITGTMDCLYIDSGGSLNGREYNEHF